MRIIPHCCLISESIIFEAINEGLEIARQGVLYFQKHGKETFRREIIIVLVTATSDFHNDGLSPEMILKTVQTAANKLKPVIYSLGIGPKVDYNFLLSLSHANGGFVRRLMENENIEKQVEYILQEIGFPVLAEINIQYSKNEVSLLRNLQLRCCGIHVSNHCLK